MGGHVIELPFERERRLGAERVRNERLSAALRMLADKLPHDLVAKYSSLTLEEVEKLAAGQTI